MEPTGFEPVTSCVQTVETRHRQTAHLQGFWTSRPSHRTEYVCRILRIFFGCFGRELANAAFSAAGSISSGILPSKATDNARAGGRDPYLEADATSDSDGTGAPRTRGSATGCGHYASHNMPA
jgi:hypothetical protein